MKRKTTEIRLILLLSVIFAIMFTMVYFTMSINTPNILMKADKTIKCLNETSTNTKNETSTNTNSSKGNTSAGKTNNTSGTSQSSKNTSNSSGSNNAKTTTKSSNADLSNLGIRPHDFSGFTPSKTTYDVTVPEDVTEVEVYATAQSTTAKIKGTGKKELKDGKNELSVVVTAESGATKTYTINVTKEAEEEEETQDVTQRADGNGLSSLKIENVELSPKFETNVYEYTAKYIGDLTKLDIKATATNEEYVIDIIGNEDLKEGENIITVLVSDEKENNIATYQITVTKSLVDTEAIAKAEAEAKKKEETKKMVIIGGAIAVVVIGIIVYLVIRHRRNSAWAEDYMMPYSEDEEEFMDDEYDYEEDNNDRSDYDEDEYTMKDAREQFLNGYNNDFDDFYDDERPRRRSKGKRFK